MACARRQVVELEQAEEAGAGQHPAGANDPQQITHAFL
jgi:hypothetical protein